MGSGEADVAHLKIANTVKPVVADPITVTENSTLGGTFDFTYPYYNYTQYYTNIIYKYQVRCPERGCKTLNWLELDKVHPCINCGKKLKAVSDVPDYTIAVK